MTVVGGSIEGITISGRSFAVVADADAKINCGGLVNRLEKCGNGTSRLVQSWSNWSVSGAVLEINIQRGDLEFLGGLRDSPGPQQGGSFTAGGVEGLRLRPGQVLNGAAVINVTFEIMLIDGTTLLGRGLPIGEIAFNTMTSTAAIDFAGDGTLDPG